MQSTEEDFERARAIRTMERCIDETIMRFVSSTLEYYEGLYESTHKLFNPKKRKYHGLTDKAMVSLERLDAMCHMYVRDPERIEREFKASQAIYNQENIASLVDKCKDYIQRAERVMIDERNRRERFLTERYSYLLGKAESGECLSKREIKEMHIMFGLLAFNH